MNAAVCLLLFLSSSLCCLCVGKDFSVAECDLKLGVLAVEIVLQAVEIACAFPFAHGQVVQQIVAASVGSGGWHFCLRENPLEALDGQAAHVLWGVGSCHDDVHAGEASHRTYIYHILFRFRVAEPSGHQVLDAVHSCWRYGWLLVGLRDAEVESGETLIYARHVDAWLQFGVVDGETLYDFHNAIVV